MPDVALHDFDRYCISCRHALRGLESHRCPECGRGFDPNDPHTTRRCQNFDVLLAQANLVKAVLYVAAPLAVIAFLLNLAGVMTSLWILGLMSLPIWGIGVAVILAMTLNARVPVSRRLRMIGITTCVLLPLALVTDWPFRFSFWIHRPWLNQIMDRIEAGEKFTGSRQIGLIHVSMVRTYPGGPHALQLMGDEAGGTLLVRPMQNAPFIWFNTNWEHELDDDWYYVYED